MKIASKKNSNAAILEEAYCLLESGEKNAIEHLYRDIYKDVFDGKNVFLKCGEHQELLSEKKGLSRCHEVDWCIPELIRKDFIPLR